MTQQTVRSRFRRAGLDALIGLAMFAFFASFAFGGDSHAGPANFFARPISTAAESAAGLVGPNIGLAEQAAFGLPTRTAGEGPIFRHTTRGMALIVLAAVFSALVAFNLALLRHLRRVYAPRRRQRDAKIT